MTHADIYTDGGLAGANPSKIGGSWAFVIVERGVQTHAASGFITPADVGRDVVSNNASELWATLEAMEYVAAGWDGVLYTDSYVTLCRIRRTKKQASLKGIPPPMRARLAAAKARLGLYSVCLLAGHPTLRELAEGRRQRNGLLASPWNVACDEMCTEEVAKFLAKGVP